MHSIERYGIVALLFLFVTIVAVLMWDTDEAKSASKGAGEAKVATAPAAALDAASTEEPAPHATQQKGQQPQGQQGEKGEGRRRLRLATESQPGPLFRDPPAATTDVVADEQAEPLEHELHSSEPILEAETPPATLTPREQPAPETVIAKSTTQSTTHEYTVRAGDTLSAIAQRELGSARRWQELVAANPGLDPSKLHVGKKLHVPGTSTAAPSEPRTASAKTAPKETPAKDTAQTVAKSAKKAPVAGAKTWKVGKGENLWKIAARALGDGKRWGEIVAVNPGLNPDRLVLGQVLALPASATPQGKSAPKSTPAREPRSAPLVAAATLERDTPAGGKVK